MPVWRLTADGALTVAADPALLGEWLPASAVVGARGGAHLVVEPRPLGVVPPVGEQTLSLLDVGAWVAGDGVVLRDRVGTLDGVLELAGPGGTLGVAPGMHAEPLLTIAMALTLGRLERALVHAAGVVAPDGRVWLLVGDTHAGKSTTTATLVRAGWGWLADDQVILTGTPNGPVVEGWARRPNLDAGYVEGTVTGRRAPSPFAAEPRAGVHPLGGVLLSRVAADAPTTLHPASATDAFTGLIRQSPWLLADPPAAAAIQHLLIAASGHSSFHLSLGRDCYGRPAELARVLGPLFT